MGRPAAHFQITNIAKPNSAIMKLAFLKGPPGRLSFISQKKIKALSLKIKITFPELPHRQFKALQCMEKYTNSNIERATRIRHRRNNMRRTVQFEKLYTAEGETLLL